MNPKEQAKPRSLGKDLGPLIEFFLSPSVLGKERLPKSGPFLVVITHYLAERTWGGCALPRPPLDAVFVSKLIEETTGQNIRWIAADSSSVARGLPLPARILIAKIWQGAVEKYGGVPVPLDREEVIARGRAVIKAIRLLAGGEIVGIAPAPGKELNRNTIEKGAALIALGVSKETGGPTTILPIRLRGFEDPIELLLSSRHNPVEAEILKPILVSFNPTKSLKEQIETLAERLLSMFSQPTTDKPDKR